MNQSFFVLNQWLLRVHRLIQDEAFSFPYDVVIVLVIQSILDQLTVQVYTLPDRTIQNN